MQQPIDAQTIGSIVQLGAVGVLFLLGLALVIYAWRRPTTSANDTVITTMSMLYDKQAAASAQANERHAAEMKMLTEKHAAEMKELIQRGIVANEQGNKVMEAMTAANQSIATNTTSHNTELTAVKQLLETMATTGSAPVQDIQQTVNRIEGKVSAIVTVRDEDTALKEDIHNELVGLIEIAKRIEAKIKTDELKKIHDSQQMPPVTTPAEPSGVGLN